VDDIAVLDTRHPEHESHQPAGAREGARHDAADFLRHEQNAFRHRIVERPPPGVALQFDTGRVIRLAGQRANVDVPLH